MPPTSPAANIMEDGPDALSTYDVEAGAETYRIRAIDAYTAERKGRAEFHKQFGFYPTHIRARYVAKAKLIEAVSDVMIIPAEVSHQARPGPARRYNNHNSHSPTRKPQ